jgi:hypothetical protein
MRREALNAVPKMTPRRDRIRVFAEAIIRTFNGDPQVMASAGTPNRPTVKECAASRPKNTRQLARKSLEVMYVFQNGEAIDEVYRLIAERQFLTRHHPKLDPFRTRRIRPAIGHVSTNDPGSSTAQQSCSDAEVPATPDLQQILSLDIERSAEFVI